MLAAGVPGTSRDAELLQMNDRQDIFPPEKFKRTRLRKQEPTHEVVCDPIENQLELLLDCLRPASPPGLTCYDTSLQAINLGWPIALRSKAECSYFVPSELETAVGEASAQFKTIPQPGRKS